MSTSFSLVSHKLKANKLVDDAAKKAVMDTLLDLQAKSVQLAPLDEGDLRRSANVRPPVVEGNKISGSLGYATPYAVRMHEDLDYTPQESGTGPKYLENPATENAAKYKKHIKDSVKRELKNAR